MLMPPFHIYFETFCQDLKHHFLTAWTDLSCGTLELFAPSSENEACSSSACAAMICVISRVRLRGKFSTPQNDEFPAELAPRAVHCVFIKEEGNRWQLEPLEAAPQQLPSHVLLCEGSVRELEAVCPHNYITACTAYLLSINPAAHKHSLTPIGLRVNLDLLLPRTVSQCLTVGRSAQ